MAGSGPNLYAYVGNSPISFRDPLGTDKRGCQFGCKAALGALGIAAIVLSDGVAAPAVAEAAEAFEAAESVGTALEAATAGAESAETYVIGNTEDVAQFRAMNGTQGYNYFIDPPWSAAANDAWIQQGIDQGATFQLATDITSTSTFNGGIFNEGFRVFGVEIGQLFNAGYTWPGAGEFLVPPIP